MRGFLALLTACFTAPAIAQEARLIPAAPRDMIMQDVRSGGSSGIGERVGNGIVVTDPALWPATFRSQFSDANGKLQTCSATLLAARATLTAAHCVGADGRVTLNRRVGQDHVAFHGRCEVAAGLDLALCHMDQAVPADHFESVRLDPSGIVRNLPLRLLGFGCRSFSPTINFDFPPGRLLLGITNIAKMPNEVTVEGQSQPSWIATTASTAGSNAYLCRGDSGGGAYWQITAQSRVIVAVNVASDRSESGESYLVALWRPEAAAFVRNWADHPQRRLRLCGVHSDAQHCS